MPVEVLKPTGSPNLPGAIERHIVERTWGRIHRLTVEAIGERVIVHGCTPSYYVKQLAIQAALEALASVAVPQLEVDIEVSGAALRSAP